MIFLPRGRSSKFFHFLRGGFLGLLLCPLYLSHTCLEAQAVEALNSFQSLQGQQNPGLLTEPAQIPNDFQSPSSLQKPPVDEIQLDLPKESKVREKAPIIISTRIFRVEGVTVFKPPEIQQLLSPYVGKDETLDSLNSLTSQLADLYHQKGYLTAQAFLPPQDIVNGVLTIRVQEGHVGKIIVQGFRFYRPRLIRNALSQKPGNLLNFKILAQDLNRINRLNDGYKVKAIVTAGAAPGQTDLHILTAEKQPFQISPMADNLGRPFIGMYRGGIDLSDNSLSGNGDRFMASWRGASNTEIGMASYAIPLNRFGTELSANVAASKVNVVLPVQAPPSIMGNSLTTSLTLSQPLDADRHFVVDSSLIWSRVNSLFDSQQTSLTDVRGFQSGLNFNWNDRWGRTFNRIQSTVALGGAVGGTDQFWQLANYFNRIIFLPKHHTLLIHGSVQLTPNALPASQQFQIGGDDSVRGYTEGLLLGDGGINFGVEDRFPVPGLHKLNPWLADRIQMALFYDYGRVWLNKNDPSYEKGISNLPDRTLLQGVGIGFRAQLTRLLQGFVDFGIGLENRKDIEPLHDQPTARVYFGVRTDILPDAYRMRSGPSVVYNPPEMVKNGN